MQERLIHSDPLTGVVTWLKTFEDGKFVFEERQDVDLVRKYAQEMRAASSGAAIRPNTQNHRRHVAEIPPVVANQLMRDGIMNGHGGIRDQKRFATWLNGPGREWKTTEGTV